MPDSTDRPKDLLAEHNGKPHPLRLCWRKLVNFQAIFACARTRGAHQTRDAF
jgi:hypothetical protein